MLLIRLLDFCKERSYSGILSADDFRPNLWTYRHFMGGGLILQVSGESLVKFLKKDPIFFYFKQLGLLSLILGLAYYRKLSRCCCRRSWFLKGNYVLVLHSVGVMLRWVRMTGCGVVTADHTWWVTPSFVLGSVATGAAALPFGRVASALRKLVLIFPCAVARKLFCSFIRTAVPNFLSLSLNVIKALLSVSVAYRRCLNQRVFIARVAFNHGLMMMALERVQTLNALLLKGYLLLERG